MLLHWGFFYDSWLIDKIPEEMELRVEEHPNGVKLVPQTITAYFGANPSYLYGEGKLYHEVIFADMGIIFVPYMFGVPMYEFIESMTMEISQDHDWLGNSSTDKIVGRVKVDDVIKTYIRTRYGIDKEHPVKATSPSSKLSPIDDDSLKVAYTPEYTPIFDTVDEFRNNFDVKMYLTMYLYENGTRDALNNKEVPVITPFSQIYTKKGILKPTINLENAKLDITEQIKPAFVDNESGYLTIFFKTNEYFNGGVVFDYGSTDYTNDNNYGFRLELTRLGVKVVSNNGTDTPNHYFIPMDIDFKTPRAFVITIAYNQYIEVCINSETPIKINCSPIRPVIKEDAVCWFSATADGRYVNTGNFEEFGVGANYMPNDTRNAFLGFEPMLNIANYEQPPESLTPIIADLTYSAPKQIAIPNGVSTYTKDSYYTGINKLGSQLPLFNKIYVSNGNKNIRSITPGKDTDNDYLNNSSAKVDSKINSTLISLSNDESIYGVLGKPDPGMDNSTEYAFMLKKLTSDTHIPIKIDVEFKLPKWWNKDMKVDFTLKLEPINKLIYYHYKKFKTGEWK